MTPFAADIVCAIERPAINDDASAASGSEDNSKDDTLIPRDTINSFRQGESVRVIGEPNRSAERNC